MILFNIAQKQEKFNEKFKIKAKSSKKQWKEEKEQNDKE